MTAPFALRSIEVAPLDIPLFTPFGISGGAHAVANNVLVTVELDDGTKGYGEGAPLPPYNGETQADVLRVLHAAQSWLPGAKAASCRLLAKEFQARGGHASGSAQAAFEMALLDALTKREGIPLWQYFGGAETSLETDMTVTTGSAEEAAAAARDIRARGIRMIKLKVGGPKGVAHDIARLRAIREVAPDAPLILDGNAGISRAQASELVREIRAAGITPALLEQWLAKDDLAGLRALREESGWSVAADESACSAEDVRRLAAEKAADFVNIKLMKSGVADALDVATAARAAGIGLMIGGNVESILAMTVSACLAAGLGGFHFCDLDTPMFLAENPFNGGYVLNGGIITLDHIKAGHGVTPKG